MSFASSKQLRKFANYYNENLIGSFSVNLSILIVYFLLKKWLLHLSASFVFLVYLFNRRM